MWYQDTREHYSRPDSSQTKRRLDHTPLRVLLLFRLASAVSVSAGQALMQQQVTQCQLTLLKPNMFLDRTVGCVWTAQATTKMRRPSLAIPVQNAAAEPRQVQAS